MKKTEDRRNLLVFEYTPSKKHIHGKVSCRVEVSINMVIDMSILKNTHITAPGIFLCLFFFFLPETNMTPP